MLVFENSITICFKFSKTDILGLQRNKIVTKEIVIKSEQLFLISQDKHTKQANLSQLKPANVQN